MGALPANAEAMSETNMPSAKPQRRKSLPEVRDQWIIRFLEHLATDRGVSIYTQRNYRQELVEFVEWHEQERKQSPVWEELQRDDFRGYVRFLGRHNLGRAAIQLRFSAMRTFYKFLVRNGALSSSPIKNIALPKPAKRLPKFLTAQQMIDLLGAPLKLLPGGGAQNAGDKNAVMKCRRDIAILETIYSSALR